MDGYLKFKKKPLKESVMDIFICPFICYFRGNYGAKAHRK